MSPAEASSPEMAYREERLGLGHTIFLSYSGADQNFLWELYDDLRKQGHDPFFDQNSLPKGAPVSMGNILQEAADCKLAVFFLSEAFFTRNKNPMSELSVCVNAGVTLLPLFYEISVDTIKSSWESWYGGEWRDWGVADEFKSAIHILWHISGIENKDGLRPREFREKVIDHIYGLVAMDTLPDVSDICGVDRLVKDVKGMFAHHLAQQSNETQPRVVVLGLYGASGTGKSTLCRMMEHSGSEADCRVCCISLDSKSSELERLKTVLRAVTDLSKELHDQLTTPYKARKKLLTHKHQRKVFLIIDNVLHQNSTEEAEFYLHDLCSRFQPGSKVLVTALTEGVLSDLFERVPLKCHIAALPDLNEEEATEILVKKAGYPLLQSGRDVEVKVEEKSLVEQCLNLCRFQKGGGRGEHYHPGVLNTLAVTIKNYRPFSNQEEITSWISFLDSRFGSSEVGKTFLRELSNDSFGGDLQKQVFLDVALYLPESIAREDELFEWLQLVQGKKSIREVVWNLMSRGLVEVCGKERLSFPLMHDLYYEMATVIVNDKESECLFVKGDGLDKRLPQKEVKRIGFQDCNFPGSLAMSSFPSSVQVLAVKNCHESAVEKLDLRGAVGLRSLELIPRGKVEGLDDFASLVYLHVGQRDSIVTRAKGKVTLPAMSKIKRNNERGGCLTLHFLKPEHRDLSLFTNLRVLALPNLRVFCHSCSGPECGESVVFELGQNIESVSVKSCQHLSALRGLSRNNCTSLRELVLRECPALKEVAGLGNCTSLRHLELRQCLALKEVEGIGELISLEKVDLGGLGLSAFPRALLKLGKQLQHLSIYDCQSIPPQDFVYGLRMPALPRIFHLQCISVLMNLMPDDPEDDANPESDVKGIHVNREGFIQDGSPPERGVKSKRWYTKLWKPQHWDTNLLKKKNTGKHEEAQLWEETLSLVVESKEALDTISNLLEAAKEADRVYVCQFVLHLCVGGMSVQLGKLLNKKHVIEAFIQESLPCYLVVLALANQLFKADLKSHASCIASMVINACNEPMWFHLQKCAASIVSTNACVANELPPEVYDRVVTMKDASYDVREELRLGSRFSRFVRKELSHLIMELS